MWDILKSAQLCSQRPPLAQRLLQKRFDLCLNVQIRIADPRDVGINSKGGGKWLACGVGDDDAEFAGDEFGADVVGVAADAEC